MAKDTVFQLRMSKEHKRIYEAEAAKHGLSLSAWIISHLPPVCGKLSNAAVEKVSRANNALPEIKLKRESKKPFVCRLKGYKT